MKSLDDMKAAPLTDDEILAIKAGVDPNDLGRPFDQEELDAISLLQRLAKTKGPATFSRVDPYARNRRHPRGDRRTNLKGEKIGPVWNELVVFQDDENKIVDLEQTRFERARQYLLRRRLHGNRATSFKKLSKAARILRGA